MKNEELGKKVLEHEKERMKELAFWEEVSELGSPSVYHFHPIAFVENVIENLAKPTWDSVTNSRIEKLHPAIRDDVYRFINQVERDLSIKLRIAQGLRTIAEQDALYAQGRTTVGSIVTNAKGGRSLHNYGLAIDILEIRNGAAIWLEGNSTEMKAISAIGKSYSFSWGGDWSSFKDYPHFERAYGYSWKQLLKKVDDGDVEGDYVNL